jgi:hypothetical protein
MLISYSYLMFFYCYSYVFFFKIFGFMCKNFIRESIKLFECERISMPTKLENTGIIKAGGMGQVMKK